MSVQELASYLNEEELAAWNTALKDKYGVTPESNPEAYNMALQRRLENERRRFEGFQQDLQSSPGYQQAIAETTLQAPVDMSREAAQESFYPSGFFSGFTKESSPVVGGLGGSRTVPAEAADIASMLPQGTEVKHVEQLGPDGVTTSAIPFVRLPGSTEFIPWNKPGVTATDIGEIAGSMASLEGLVSVLFTRFPMSNILSKTFTTGVGAAIGAAGDEFLRDPEAPEFADVLTRAGSAFALSSVFDLGAAGLVGATNFSLGRGGFKQGKDPIQEAGQEAQEITGRYALEPLQIGQDRGFTGKLVSRLSQYSDSFRTKLINQQLALGKSISAVAEEFDNLDSLDQGLYLAGLRNEDLENLYQYKVREIEAKQRAMMSSVENPQSRSAGGRAIQQGLFQISNKDRTSFRLVMNARLNTLEDAMEDAAATTRFDIDITNAQTWAREQLEAMPVPQVPDGNARVGDLYDGSGNTFEFVNKVNDSALRSTLELLRDIPNGRLTNDMTVPAYVYAGMDAKTGKPKYRAGDPVEVSGLQVLRMLRGSLSDFYGNELVRGTTQEGIAKQAYQRLSEALKGATGSPQFVGAVRKYNAASSYTYNTLDKLVSMNMASMKDPASMVNTFVNGGMDFQTWNYMRRALLHTGPQGQRDIQLFKEKVTDYYFANPNKIESMKDLDPKVLNSLYTPAEQGALKQYKALIDFEKRDSFVKKAAEYNTAKQRALTLFNQTPDEDFSFLMRVLPENSKRAMRAAVVQDLLSSARRNVAGVEGVPDPKKLAANLQTLLDEMGPRARALFSPEQLRALSDHKKISAFYEGTSQLNDTGAGIAAAQTTGQALGLGGAGLEGAAAGGIKVIWEKRLADLIADGPLGVFFQPKLGKPLSDQRIRELAVLTGTSIDTTMRSSMPKKDEREYLEKARELRRKEEQAKYRGRNKAP